MISQGPDELVVRVGQAEGAGLGLEGLVGLRSATGLSCVGVGTCTVTCLLRSLKQNTAKLVPGLSLRTLGRTTVLAWGRQERPCQQRSVCLEPWGPAV